MALLRPNSNGSYAPALFKSMNSSVIATIFCFYLHLELHLISYREEDRYAQWLANIFFAGAVLAGSTTGLLLVWLDSTGPAELYTFIIRFPLMVRAWMGMMAINWMWKEGSLIELEGKTLTMGLLFGVFAGTLLQQISRLLS